MVNEYMDVALVSRLSIAELEQDLVAHPPTCEVDQEAAATVSLLAMAGVSLPQVGAYMRGERREH